MLRAPLKRMWGKMTPVLSLNYTIKLQPWQQASSRGWDPCFKTPRSQIKWRSMVMLRLRTIWRWGEKLHLQYSHRRGWMKSGSVQATAGWRELTCGDSLPPEGKWCPGLDGVCRNWTVIIRTRPPGQRSCGISDFFNVDAGGGPRGTW